jgi:hypothetical protein
VTKFNDGGSALLRCDWGAAPKDVGDLSLWHGRLSVHQKIHQRGRNGEKGEFFTGDELPRRRRQRQSSGAGCKRCSGCVCRCEASAKGESGSLSSALNRDGGRGEMRGRGGWRLAIISQRIVRA